jgi:hypothetical protein
LSGVRTPERSQSPQNAYITEEELFKELNPEVKNEIKTPKLTNSLSFESEYLSSNSKLKTFFHNLITYFISKVLL